MIRKTTTEGELGGFLAAVGSSLGAAQGGLLPDGEQVPGMMIAEADLEVRALLGSSGGKLMLRTVSATEAVVGRLDTNALSTVRLRFVATAPNGDTPKPAATSGAVIDSVRKTRDIRELEKALGGLELQAEFIPGSKRWLVTAGDSAGRVVREVIVPDTAEGRDA